MKSIKCPQEQWWESQQLRYPSIKECNTQLHTSTNKEPPLFAILCLKSESLAATCAPICWANAPHTTLWEHCQAIAIFITNSHIAKSPSNCVQGIENAVHLEIFHPRHYPCSAISTEVNLNQESVSVQWTKLNKHTAGLSYYHCTTTDINGNLDLTWPHWSTHLCINSTTSISSDIIDEFTTCCCQPRISLIYNIKSTVSQRAQQTVFKKQRLFKDSMWLMLPFGFVSITTILSSGGSHRHSKKTQC